MLADHVLSTVRLLFDYSEFVDYALAAADELVSSIKSRDGRLPCFARCATCIAEAFRAVARTMADRFTPLDRCFVLFAANFLVNDAGTAHLLESNKTPAFYQHGVRGGPVVAPPGVGRMRRLGPHGPRPSNHHRCRRRRS